jgi:hypothetical protein
MVDIARLQIEIDSSGIKTAGRELDSLAKRGTRVGRNLTAGLTVPLVAGMAGAVREAALLEGAFDKFDVVFGSMNREMRDFVEVYNSQFPISRRETVQLAANLQDLLVPMGLNRTEAALMTQDWLELAGALSAFNDVPVERVLSAISSGMAGQSEALRRYGIDARATTLETVALEQGLLRAGEAMNEQVRQQALLIQATNQSADAIGGLEQQQGSLLWQMEELKRDARDLAGIYGQELIPIASELIEGAKETAAWFKELDSDTQKLIVQTGLLGAAIGPVVGGLSWALVGAGKAAVTMTKATRALTAAMLANPYLAVGAAILAIGTKAYFTNRKIQDFHDTINEALGGNINTQTIEDVNDLIAKTSERLEGVQRAENLFAVESRETEQLKQYLNELVTLRNQLALQEIDGIISDKAAANARETEQAVRELMQAVEGVHLAMQAPEETIFDPSEAAQLRQMRREFQEFNGVLDEILMQEDVDFSHRLGMDEFNNDMQEAINWSRELGFTLEQSFLAGITGGRSFLGVLDQIFTSILRLTAQQFVTNPLQNALNNSGFLNGLSGAESVDDLIISDTGRVFKPHPDDTILALKNIDPLTGGGGSGTPNVNVNVAVQNEVSNAQVDIRKQRMPNGDLELVAIIRDINKGLHNSGQMDRTMAANYGIRRKGVNYG